MADVGAALTGTQLPLMDELAFRQWVKDNGVPFNPDVQGQDYDMRGFYRGIQQQNPKARTEVNPNDNKLHFTDYWKMPSHESFSGESKYAGPDAPHWKGDQLVDKEGKVVFDEKLLKLLRGD